MPLVLKLRQMKAAKILAIFAIIVAVAASPVTASAAPVLNADIAPSGATFSDATALAEPSANEDTPTKNDNPPTGDSQDSGQSPGDDENNGENIPPAPTRPPIQIARVSTKNGDEFVQIGNFSEDDVAIGSLEIQIFNSVDKNISTKLFALPDGIFAKNSFVALGKNFSDFASNPVDKSIPDSSGAVQLFVGGEKVDEVCWGDSQKCDDATKNLPKISDDQIIASSQLNPLNNGENSAEFVFAERPGIIEKGGFTRTQTDDSSGEPSDATPASAPDAPENPDCQLAKLNEIGANLDAQFIELQNPEPRDLNLAGCQLMTNRSATKKFIFANETLPAGGFLAVNVADTGLTLTKTTTGKVLFGDATTDYDEVNYANLPSGTSFARFPDGWKSTYTPSPNRENVFEQYPPCAANYARNLATGRCDKIAKPAVSALKTCDAGQFLNPATNRCKKIATPAALVACAPGSTRNPLTNRCNKVEKKNAPAPCPAGSTRNPDTSRCRKDAANSVAKYPVKSSAAPESADWKFAALAVVGATLLVVAAQFSAEIRQFFANVKGKFLRGEAAE